MTGAVNNLPASTAGHGIALAHLKGWMARVRLLIQRYMRRYADRLLQADGSYSDLCVGPQEMRRILGMPPELDAQRWLDALGIAPSVVIDEELDAVRQEQARFLATLPEGVVLPIEELRAGFGLTDLELDLLMLGAAPRLSMDLSRLYAVAWSDFSMRQPTAGFLAEVAAPTMADLDEAMSLMIGEAPLVRYHLMVAGTHELWKPETPRIHAPMIVPQRILDYLTGDLLEQAGLPGCALTDEGLGQAELVLDPQVRADLMGMLRRAQPRVALLGSKGSGRRTIVQSFTARTGHKLLTVELAQALTLGREPVLVQLAEILREARLHHAALLLRLDGLEDTPLMDAIRAKEPAVRALLADFPNGIYMTGQSRTLLSVLVPGLEPLTIGPPPRDGQRDLWRRALGPVLDPESVERMANDLAGSYRLSPGSIHRAVNISLDNDVKRTQRSGRQMSMPRLLKSIRRQFDHNLGWLADAVVVNMRLGDVVLSKDLKDQVNEILLYAQHSEQVFEKWRFRDKSPGGTGMPVMFSGPPGTGKTLLAGVLAHELGRALYKVDLSRIVDKYIGETEKNLGKVFDEAERAQAMLLFDEADSLFAKRTSVKSSNDRYANLEVNYLLQRLESFDGMSILTTNFPSSIDEAFQRRIRFKVAFPMPDAELRERLWRKLMPPDAPVDRDIDFAALAEGFTFSGGHIRNAVLRASIQAAGRGTAITQEMLANAGISESREMGMLIRSDD